MDKKRVDEEKRAKKKSINECNRSEKKEVKVVYIANPMKFQTSAANFRELVQKFTGQDSDDITDNLPETTTSTSASSAASGQTMSADQDDAFAESWSAFVPPSMFYEPPQGFFRPPNDQL